MSKEFEEIVLKKFEELNNKIDSKLGSLEKKMDSKIDNLGNRIDNLGNRIDNLENRIDNLENRIDNLENRIDNLDKKFTAFQKDITTKLMNFEKFTILKFEELKEVKTDLTITKQKVEHMEQILEKDIPEMFDKYISKQEKQRKEIDSLELTIENHEVRISALEKKVV